MVLFRLINNLNNTNYLSHSNIHFLPHHSFVYPTTLFLDVLGNWTRATMIPIRPLPTDENLVHTTPSSHCIHLLAPIQPTYILKNYMMLNVLKLGRELIGTRWPRFKYLKESENQLHARICGPLPASHWMALKKSRVLSMISAMPRLR